MIYNGILNSESGEAKPEGNLMEPERCYFSTAIREFRLTKHQLECGIRDGILNVLTVRNPHHKSGPLSRMLYRAEILRNLSRMMTYPKLSEKKEQTMRAKRTVFLAKSRARDELEFFCDTCQSSIRAPSGYPPFEEYCQGRSGISRERLIELLRRYHVRHWHTNIEEVSRKRFVQNVRKGMEFMEAATEAKEYAQKMVKNADNN